MLKRGLYLEKLISLNKNAVTKQMMGSKSIERF